MTLHPWIAEAAAVSTLVLLTGCTGSPSEPTNRSTEAVVTLRGVNGAAVRSLPIVLGDVNITADGRLLSAVTEPGAIDLARGDETVAARFKFPAEAREVFVEICLDEYGGFEATNGETGAVDARGSNIALRMLAPVLARSGTARVAVDLLGSLAPRGAGLQAFTPQVSVEY